MLKSRDMPNRIFTFLFLAAAVLTAQTASEVEITAEPHHHLALENAYIRAFKVEVPPGQATLMHRHRHDYIYVVLGLTEISNQVEGKPAVSMKLHDGETRSLDGGFAHIAANVGPTPFRNVTIELLQDEQARKSPPPAWDEERGLRVLDGGTIDIIFVKDGVRVSETDLQPSGMIPQHHHAGPYLVVAITDLDLRTDVPGKAASEAHLKAGDIKWSPGNLAHSVMNIGKQQAKFVTLEFH
jgi:quercetin dioxygenase-like cupin family protein